MFSTRKATTVFPISVQYRSFFILSTISEMIALFFFFSDGCTILTDIEVHRAGVLFSVNW